jgi:predicted enzyme related to lactoylglutathione lyase
MSGMDVSSVTMALPVSDLGSAVTWYRQVLELSEPELEPAAGVVEFKFGSAWLQLGEEPTTRSGAQVIIRFGVDDAGRERQRLERLGVPVGPLEHVPGVVDYFDFTDPDGNVLSMYSELG